MSKHKSSLHVELRGKISNELIDIIADELQDILKKESNFANTLNKGIRKRIKMIEKHIELWRKKRYEELHEIFIKLVENDTHALFKEDEEIENVEIVEDCEPFIDAELFNIKMHTRNLTAATRFITQSQNKGGFKS